MKEMTLDNFIMQVRQGVMKLAEENTEANYLEAKEFVAEQYRQRLFPLTDKQVTKIVNTAWDLALGGACNE